MVDQAHADRLAGLGHPPGEGQVFRTRRRVAARMSVEEDQPTGTEQQPFAQQGTGLDGGSGERAAKELAIGEQSVATVEKEGPHHLLVANRVAQGEVARDCGGMGERRALGHFGSSEPPRQLDRGEHARRLGLAQTPPAKRGGARGGQSREAPSGGEERPRHLQRRSSRVAGAQQDGDELGVTERGRPLGDETLSRPLVRGKLGDGAGPFDGVHSCLLPRFSGCRSRCRSPGSRLPTSPISQDGFPGAELTRDRRKLATGGEPATASG